jgi:hypothetical protein
MSSSRPPEPRRWAPGTIAVDWEHRAVLVRSFDDDYWYDSRYPGVGCSRRLDKSVTPDKYEILASFTARYERR